MYDACIHRKPYMLKLGNGDPVKREPRQDIKGSKVVCSGSVAGPNRLFSNRVKQPVRTWRRGTQS